MQTQLLIPYVLSIIINSNSEILFLYRKNNEWFQGYYSLVGGKINQKESAKQALAREIYEEVGITCNEKDLEFVHVMHFMGEDTSCIALFYLIRIWQGTAYNKEQDKHDHIEWFSLDKLPSALIPRHRKALELLAKKIYYSEDNW